MYIPQIPRPHFYGITLGRSVVVMQLSVTRFFSFVYTLIFNNNENVVFSPKKMGLLVFSDENFYLFNKRNAQKSSS